ncbi:MAG: aldehyde dehydrogenase family protein [Hyphomicrobiales bacterium]|jgi:succinate-semialdehyde dehydrogenase/glutarate-semialdehyde dehydrogenase|nr:aldehyde dehydrogenase family protein [Hyphomicrobiales bacterium]
MSTSAILRRAADLLRAQLEPAAQLLSPEQGKPLAEAQTELRVPADIIE